MKTRHYFVVIDPGHGSEPGAVNPALGIEEKNLTLRLALAVKEKVEKGDYLYRVALTREDDSLVPLSVRVALANSMKADVFVSLHYNSATVPAARGYEVWTSPGQTKADDLAVGLLMGLGTAMPWSKGRFDYDDGDPDKEANFYVLRHTTMPAALVEVEFLSNPSVAPLLTEEGLIGRLAEEIAEAVELFLEG